MVRHYDEQDMRNMHEFVDADIQIRNPNKTFSVSTNIHGNVSNKYSSHDFKVTKAEADLKQECNHGVFNYRHIMNASNHTINAKYDWLILGLDGTEVVKPKCTPGVCFRNDMCIETAQGVECGPCPDGYTGDGYSCDDVDEVRICSSGHIKTNGFFSWYSLRKID